MHSTPAVLSPEELFKRVSPSVFVVVSLDASKHAVEQGSAVAIGKGLLETNYHVIKDGASFQAQQGTRKWPATLVATNPDRDVAELRVANLDAPVVPMRPFSSLAIGEHVYAIGAPEGLELTLSEGLISSLRQSGDDRVIQTTAAISPGSSGGGLFDTSGRLVGITVAYLKEGQNLNFALPTDSLSSVRSASAWGKLGSEAYEAGSKYDGAINYDLGFQSYKLAADDYQQAVRLNPKDEDALRHLGDAYDKNASELLASTFTESDRESAARRAANAYQGALQLKPNDKGAWIGLARAYEDQGQSKGAINAYKNALRFDPNDIEAWEALGELYALDGEDDNALTAFDTAQAAIKSNDDKAQASLCDSLVNGTRFAPSIDLDPRFPQRVMGCAQRLIKLRPNDVDGWCDLGLAYADEKDRVGVLKVYEKLKTLDPNTANDFFKLFVAPNQK